MFIYCGNYNYWGNIIITFVFHRNAYYLLYSFKWLISCRELVMPLLGSNTDMVLIYPSIIICLFESFLHCSLWLSIDNDVTGRWCLGLTIQSLAPGVGSRMSSFWYLLVWVERGMWASGVAKLSCIDNLGQSGYHNAHLVKYVCIHYMPELLIRFMESESFCSLLFCWYCLQWCNVAIVAVGLIYSVITPSSFVCLFVWFLNVLVNY